MTDALAHSRRRRHLSSSSRPERHKFRGRTARASRGLLGTTANRADSYIRGAAADSSPRTLIRGRRIIIVIHAVRGGRMLIGGGHTTTYCRRDSELGNTSRLRLDTPLQRAPLRLYSGGCSDLWQLLLSSSDDDATTVVVLIHHDTVLPRDRSSCRSQFWRPPRRPSNQFFHRRGRLRFRPRRIAGGLRTCQFPGGNPNIVIILNAELSYPIFDLHYTRPERNIIAPK